MTNDFENTSNNSNKIEQEIHDNKSGFKIRQVIECSTSHLKLNQNIINDKNNANKYDCKPNTNDQKNIKDRHAEMGAFVVIFILWALCFFWCVFHNASWSNVLQIFMNLTFGIMGWLVADLSHKS